MGSGDGEDDRTFRVNNFTAEGFAKLRERVKDKLKEFMGDYTDDTLVEYVIVLLKNGRQKEEARNELNVFLGEDSDSFVAWLWDHLGSNIGLYVQQKDPDTGGGTKNKPISAEPAAKNDLHHLDSDADKVKSNKSRSRRREWKGLVAVEHPTLHSSLADSTPMEEEAHQKVGHSKRSLSPQPELQRKRNRPEERPKKREGIRQPAIAATRRLLQFAVRDAVATSRPSNSNLESSPSLKRLRSVVSTSVEDSSLQERPQRIRSVARAPNAMATAIRAVAEAAKDVAKVRSSANVFDRLGRATGALDPSSRLEESNQAVAEDVQDQSFADASTYLHRSNYRGKHIGKSTLNDDTAVLYDSALDEEADHGISIVNKGAINASRTGARFKNIGETPLVVEYGVTDNANDILHKSQKDQDRPTFAPGAPHQPMNVPLNVNTWKSPQYQEARQALEIENQRSTQSSEGLASEPDMLLTKESTNPIAVTNGNVKPYADTQKESQKMASIYQGLYSTGPPTEDADSRTIFVNNVHFAATKDSLSRHFNKFGEVLKVVILTDAATGQPKGSAYVEFMRKESAENALSLDGTSFMSRILKVVRKSSATPEAASVTVWPRVTRSGPFAVSRFGRVPFPRGIPTLYRSRLPVRPGARSMQWKRDAQPTSAENSGLLTPSINAVPSPIPRSMTYVRAESKINGDSSTA
ncbi:PREDICTED: uncharacterized protein LOC109241047 [Nicotiana attenuata]|uniref:Polyadenylate-binding protein 2 n=1 Tax=Nicotiana attenuata TaxID=49451 RepID=A0A314L6K4_NICAT|nr:PREDICTED: uncharacterized protein LOC109241047 [Nicotiana attenuata]OIT37250.1 polyadenylate-binding protein 2 [Nicotiana attenuata]